MDKELNLLSDSFYAFLQDVWNETDNPIIFELLYSQDLINEYNSTDNESVQIKLKNNIDNHLTDYARMLTFRNNEFTISFLPKGKEPKYSGNDTWSRENRQFGKPIKIIQKIVKRKFTNRDYELLNNLLKSKLLNQGEFGIVEGEDIQYWYYERNNDEGATLSNSCMRYSECSPYLELYTDICKMLVLFNSNKSLIYGRALLWEIDGKTYMDRVYYSRDWYYNLFIDYAHEHKFYHRSDNSLLSTGVDQMWVGPEDNYSTPKRLFLSIQLPKNYDCYPYMDSFRYLMSDNRLYDCCPDDEECWSCDNTDGSISCLEKLTCASCGHEEYCLAGSDPEELFWSSHDECYYCENCAAWVAEADDYVANEDIVTIWDADGDSFEDAIWNIQPSKYIEIDGEYYVYDCPLIKYVEDLDKYILVDE